MFVTNQALLTDLYQLTMAYGYWRLQRTGQRAVFHLFFRSLPFSGGYVVSCGQQLVQAFVESFRFTDEDLSYLATLRGNDQQPLWDDRFLDYLADLSLTCDIDAMPEGTVAFANEPILRIEGPLLECQLLETPLLNLINFSSLIATKAARICGAAGDAEVIEFGLRRAQGPDGGVTASRAAYIGGCTGTSNLLAGKCFGIPVRGTHAHSWVMAFEDEPSAFEAYGQSLPNNCIFLVDTYDTLQGVRHACQVAKRLKPQGISMAGIRLDSGDLAYLSIAARRILDENGFADAKIVASNDLDETIIENLMLQGARIDAWGVGTKLATSYDQPALGGVYKLGALEDSTGNWKPKLKRSDQTAKTTIPGVLGVYRYRTEEGAVADMIYDVHEGIDPRKIIVDPKDRYRRRVIEPEAIADDLLVPMFRAGQPVGEAESMQVIRERVRTELQSLHPTIRRLLNPHEYPVGLDLGLSQRREQMIESMGDFQ